LLPYEIRLSIQDYIFPWKEDKKRQRNKMSFGYAQGYFESLVARQPRVIFNDDFTSNRNAFLGQQQQQQQQQRHNHNQHLQQHLHVNPFEDEEEEEKPTIYFEPGGVRGGLWKRL
jgi:hypothetical protein